MWCQGENTVGRQKAGRARGGSQTGKGLAGQHGELGLDSLSSGLPLKAFEQREARDQSLRRQSPGELGTARWWGPLWAGDDRAPMQVVVGKRGRCHRPLTVEPSGGLRLKEEEKQKGR